jgi:hypothetical protein
MSHRKIPYDLQHVIGELVKERKSTRHVAEWLRTEHHINASHMAVHRFIERQRLVAFGAPDIDAELAEAHGEVGAHLRTLSALSEQFGELGEQAMQGDTEAGIKPDTKLASRLFEKQARLIIDWLRCLDRYTRARAEAVSEAQEATRKVFIKLQCTGSEQLKQAGELREWERLVAAANQRRRAVGFQPLAGTGL